MAAGYSSESTTFIRISIASSSAELSLSSRFMFHPSPSGPFSWPTCCAGASSPGGSCCSRGTMDTASDATSRGSVASWTPGTDPALVGHAERAAHAGIFLQFRVAVELAGRADPVGMLRIIAPVRTVFPSQALVRELPRSRERVDGQLLNGVEGEARFLPVAIVIVRVWTAALCGPATTLDFLRYSPG